TFVGIPWCTSPQANSRERIMKPKLKIATISSLAFVLSVVIAGCEIAPGNPKGAPPAPVKVSYPVQREVTAYSDLTGRTAAVDSVEIRARVWGYVDKFNFKEGMLVQKGDVLFEIDPRTYKATLDQAEGRLASLAARAERLESDFARAQRLIKTNTIAQEEYDRVVGDREETKAEIEAQKAAVKQARLDPDFTQAVAPLP